MYIKKVVRLCELVFADLIIITLRSLFQSPILLSKISDPITIPQIFRLFLKAHEGVHPESETRHYILECLNRMAADFSARKHVLQNQQIIKMVNEDLGTCDSTSDQEPTLAIEAAKVLVSLLKPYSK